MQLRDGQARARIAARIDRMQAGLRGDWKSVGAGVLELRVDYGPGYRIYFAQDGAAVVLLLWWRRQAVPAMRYIEVAHGYGRTSRRAHTSASSAQATTCAMRTISRHTWMRSWRRVTHVLVPVALRTIAGAVGGMAALAERTGLSRETLYRTLSEKGKPRLETLVTILEAFGLRIAAAPARKRAIGERC